MGLDAAKALFFKLTKKHEHNKQWEVGRALFQCLNMRDIWTSEHSLLVGYYSYQIAQKLNLDKDSYFLAGVLHDIGKIEMSDVILKTNKFLSKKERKLLNNHVLQGAILLGEFNFEPLIVNFCSQHHERLDGSGYPFGIEQSNFNIEGRIASVADVFSALTTSRKYRDDVTYNEQEALNIMLKEQEEKYIFDPGILSVLKMYVHKDRSAPIKEYMYA